MCIHIPTKLCVGIFQPNACIGCPQWVCNGRPLFHITLCCYTFTWLTVSHCFELNDRCFSLFPLHLISCKPSITIHDKWAEIMTYAKDQCWNGSEFTAGNIGFRLMTSQNHQAPPLQINYYVQVAYQGGLFCYWNAKFQASVVTLSCS